MSYQCSKTYGHEEGLSVCFRQWKAKSHCRFLHGYALSVKLTFECEERDSRGWVLDFGGLKPVKQWLKMCFDHKTVVAVDDPMLDGIRNLSGKCLALHTMDEVGCEAFASFVGRHVDEWLAGRDRETISDINLTGLQHLDGYGHRRVWLRSCEIAEHGGNAAAWINPSKR